MISLLSTTGLSRFILADIDDVLMNSARIYRTINGLALRAVRLETDNYIPKK
ncbi:hypothetical protein [Bartonella sp. DGB2]|uniref:hypothetical protein n=1 Tax=Bartonella sp. DGB2 TaxID=3388426 RepID=UPI00398FD595